MMVARIERKNPDAVTAALTQLLKDAPKGLSAQLDAVPRAILELRAPERVRNFISTAIGLWDQPNMLLLASNLSALIDEVALPARDRFSLMRPLISGEEKDDWRDKYWFDPSLPGQFVTPFAEAIRRTVAEDPAATFPGLLDLLASKIEVEQAVARYLLRKSAAAAPQICLEMAWPRYLAGQRTPFKTIYSSIPTATATFLATLPMNTAEERLQITDCLWQVVAYIDQAKWMGKLFESGAAHEVAAAADHVLQRLHEPNLRVRALVVRLLYQYDSALERELIELWSSISDEDYWTAIKAASTKWLQLLTDLLEGTSERNVKYLISRMPIFDARSSELDILAQSLSKFADGGADSARSVSSGIESQLHASEHLEGGDGLWRLAQKLASSPDAETRNPLICFSSSRNSTSSLQLSRRDTILGMLVDNESGQNVDVLIWKIMRIGARAIKRC